MNLKRVSALILSLGLVVAANATGQKSICGQDDRTPSQNPKVGRLLESVTATGGCTVTMISKTCGISAGHCSNTFGVAEFNTPASVGGRIQHPSEENIYPVMKDDSVWTYRGLGNDWAVLRIGKNKITGEYAGDAQGHYDVDFAQPQNGTLVRITGYGLDRNDPERNLAQQTHTGDVVRMRGSVMYHIADTMGGNSGSSIIRESDDKIIAIHTNGGCYSRGGSNSATMISLNTELTEAIKTCLAEEVINQ